MLIQRFNPQTHLIIVAVLGLLWTSTGCAPEVPAVQTSARAETGVCPVCGGEDDGSDVVLTLLDNGAVDALGSDFVRFSVDGEFAAWSQDIYPSGGEVEGIYTISRPSQAGASKSCELVAFVGAETVQMSCSVP